MTRLAGAGMSWTIRLRVCSMILPLVETIRHVQCRHILQISTLIAQGLPHEVVEQLQRRDEKLL